MTENLLIIEISDDGKEFDPFDRPEADILLPTKDPKRGGLGLHLVRRMLDACAYDRRDGRNTIRLSKKL